jgi:chitinase
LASSAAAAMAVGAAVAVTTNGLAATSAVTVVCATTTPAWTEGPTYTVGQNVTYQGRLYRALVTHTAYAGAGWVPSTTPSLWTDLGACTGGTPTTNPPTTTPTTRPPTTSPTTTPPTTRPPTTTPPTTIPPTGGITCPVKSRPAGKVLQGYWENWDGARNGVHPGMGWIPITDSRIQQHGYNVIMAAFPVIQADGTALWATGMLDGVTVATPAEMCAAKAAGATILLSIGGATAGIDLSSSAVADKFVTSVVKILQDYNFDGIDIDIETGLTGSGNINTLSTSQANLIRIIDGVLARMPSNFGLTMAPETAYVTGGAVTYGSIWGSYLPIINKYLNNGRLWWLNMQYYNGSMYDCAGTSYDPGVDGFERQTNCLAAGLLIGNTTTRIPLDKQVPGLPAQPGAANTGYLTPATVSTAYGRVSGIKGLMTWSINWDGSRGWTFGDNVKRLEGR